MKSIPYTIQTVKLFFLLFSISEALRNPLAGTVHGLVVFGNGGGLLFMSVYITTTEINARALIGRSAMGYCASKKIKKPRVFQIII